jgi:L-lysine exporter family protein LysE/ArgO
VTIFLTGLLTSLALVVAIGAQSLYIMRQAIRRDRLALVLALCMLGDIVLITAGTSGVGMLAEGAPWVIEVLRWGGVAYLLWFAVGSFRSAFGARRSMAVDPDAGAGPDGGVEPDGGVGPGPGREDDPVLVGAGVGGGAEAGAQAPAGTSVAVAERPRPAERTEQTEWVGRPHRAASPRRTLTPVRAVVLASLSVSLLNPHSILDTVVMLGTLANSYEAGRWVFAGGALAGSAIWFLTLGLGARALAPVLDTPKTWRIVDLVVGAVMVFIAATLALG